MGSRSPAAQVCDRTQPMAKSEASASMVSGWSGWKCCRMGAAVLFQNLIHKSLKHGRCIGGTHGTDPKLVMPLPTPEGSFPFVPLPDPDLMICIPKVNFGEHFCFVEAVVLYSIVSCSHV